MQLAPFTFPPIIPQNNARTSLIHHAQILVVEDSRTQQEVLDIILLAAGFKNITYADNGNDALELIKFIAFDLILLDLYLPDISGLVVCQCIKDHNFSQPPAVILQTGSADAWHKVKAFESGASDYITKPVDESELIMRSIIHLERRYLALQLAEKQKRIAGELAAAADTQHQLLPTTKQVQQIANQTHTDIASYVQFSSELGGDLWGIKLMSPNVFNLYTVDFSGHGLKAALNTFPLHAFMQKLPPATPSATISTVNEYLCPVLPTSHYATMLSAQFNMTELKLTYCTAGASLPIILRDNKVVALTGSGVPLGCIAGCVYDEYSISLQKGDTLLIYSDALVEHIPNLNQEDIVSLLRTAQGSAEQVLNALVTQLKTHLEQEQLPLQDDLTLILIKL